MKEQEVPQDDANMLEGKTREIQYALDEDGNYTEVKSVGWKAKNIILEQAWDEVNSNIELALEAVRLGEKSPIFYFMYKHVMDVKILSEYSGFRKWKVKRHFRPKVFNKMSVKSLERYIEAFRMDSINELINFDANKI